MSHNTSNKHIYKTPDKKNLSVKTMLKMYERNYDVQIKSTKSQKAERKRVQSYDHSENIHRVLFYE